MVLFNVLYVLVIIYILNILYCVRNIILINRYNLVFNNDNNIICMEYDNL